MNQFTADLWKVMHGYYLGFIKILPRLALSIILFLLFLFVARQVRRWLLPRLFRNSGDNLLTGFLGDIGYWIVMILGISTALGALGFDGAVTKILAGAGLSAFILGFALKDIGENFLAGILLAFKRPFQLGDLVETQGVKGRVIDMTLRETVIKTLDGKDVYVPNAGVLNNPLYNYSVDDFLRLEFSVELDNREDYKKAIPLLEEALKETKGVLHDDNPLHEAVASVEETKSNALCLKVSFWIQSSDAEKESPAIKSRAIQNVLDTLKQNGFSHAPQTTAAKKE